MAEKVLGRSNVFAFFILFIGASAAVLLPFAPFTEALTWPLRILTTLVHEGSHGLMTVLTQGKIASIVLRRDGSGTLSSIGGVRVLILFAGYLGTCIFGFLLLITAMRASLARILLCTTGVSFILLVLLHSLFSPFTFFTGVAAGALFLVVAYKAGNYTTMFLSAFLGTNIIMNGFSDQLYLILVSSSGFTNSDAGYMENEFGFPAVFWAICWMAMSIYFLTYGSYIFLSQLRKG